MKNSRTKQNTNNAKLAKNTNINISRGDEKRNDLLRMKSQWARIAFSGQIYFMYDYTTNHMFA